MSKIKLEVGKTYRNRNGEEVRIIEKIDGWGSYPYQGINGKWYTESGRWDNLSTEHPEDLIEEVEEASYAFITPDDMKKVTTHRYTFTIPSGTKGINVSKEDNRIIVEMVPEKGPKPGDVMVNDNGSVYIFKEVDGDGDHRDYAWLGKDGRLHYNSAASPGRPATPEEAQPLWDALKKAGKRWNPESMQVEEVPEIDRIREWVEEHLNDGHYNQQWIAGVIGRYLKHREGKK